MSLRATFTLFGFFQAYCATLLQFIRGEVNDDKYGDDEEADDDGGDGHLESFLAESSRAVIVLQLITFPGQY